MVAFVMLVLTCPLAIVQSYGLAAFPDSWKPNLRVAEGKNVVEVQQQLFAWKESCFFWVTDLLCHSSCGQEQEECHIGMKGI